MARKATKCIPVRPDTKNLVDEQKPEGVTFDHWIRKQMDAERDQ